MLISYNDWKILLERRVVADTNAMAAAAWGGDPLWIKQCGDDLCGGGVAGLLKTATKASAKRGEYRFMLADTCTGVYYRVLAGEKDTSFSPTVARGPMQFFARGTGGAVYFSPTNSVDVPAAPGCVFASPLFVKLQDSTECWETNGVLSLAPEMQMSSDGMTSNDVTSSIGLLEGPGGASLDPNCNNIFLFGGGGGKYLVTARSRLFDSVYGCATLTVTRVAFDQTEALIPWSDDGSRMMRDYLDSESYPTNLQWQATTESGHSGSIDSQTGVFTFSPDGGGKYTIGASAPDRTDCSAEITLIVPSLDLDVNGNTLVNDSMDGVTNYLPGYEETLDGRYTAKLSTGNSFLSATYTGQCMTLVLTGIGAGSIIDEVSFEILSCSINAGYCENATNAAITGSGKDHDFSFAQLQDEDTISIYPGSSATEIHGGKMEDDRTWVRFWCKDYGGKCKVKVTGWINGCVVFTLPDLQVPLDNDDDGIADVYERMQLINWQNECNPEVDANDLTYFSAADDTEPQNPHATSGDGLTCFEEYRGYILDGGPKGFNGGHKRLNFARKELLVQISEQDNMMADVGTGDVPNPPAMAAYSLNTVMQYVSDFYCDPNGGACLDLYWARTTFSMPIVPVHYTDTNYLPRSDAYRFTGVMRYIDNANTTNRVVNGGAWIYWDEILRRSNKDEFDSIYGTSKNGTGFPYFISLNRDDEALRRFVKVMSVSRFAHIDGLGTVSLRNDKSAEHSVDDPLPYQGAHIDPVSISEENIFHDPPGSPHYTPSEYLDILSFSFSHELGHILRLKDNENVQVSGVLMGVRTPLSNVSTTSEEKQSMKVKERGSVLP